MRRPHRGGAAPSGGDTIVQFVVVRRDLLKDMEWPVGSVIAQATRALPRCGHATTHACRST